MTLKLYFFSIIYALTTFTALAKAQVDNYGLRVNVQQIEDRKFATHASFVLPLKHCQAWKYLVNYDSSAQIPGVVSAQTIRLNNNKARVSLVMEEGILFFKVRMLSVIDFVESVDHGTDFVQVSGDAKSFQGSWRIQPNGAGTLFEYRSTFQPDSALPMVVIKYFFDRRLQNSFAAIAEIGAAQKLAACE